jgi:hypothetical protein
MGGIDGRALLLWRRAGSHMFCERGSTFLVVDSRCLGDLRVCCGISKWADEVFGHQSGIVLNSHRRKALFWWDKGQRSPLFTT